MGIPIAWQLAVITNWLSLKDLKTICCMPRPEWHPDILDAGFVVYIVNCNLDKSGIARCYLPTRRVYADIYLSDLRPVMCENDVLEIELEYPHSNLGQWLKQLSMSKQK